MRDAWEWAKVVAIVVFFIIMLLGHPFFMLAGLYLIYLIVLAALRGAAEWIGLVKPKERLTPAQRVRRRAGLED